MRRIVARFDHFGFLAQPRPVAELTREAAAAGFDHRPRSFPSTIVARELADLLGRESVSMTIFQAESLVPGGPIAIEVLMPDRVDDQDLETWHSRGIGSHLAFRLKEAADFAELAGLLARAGFETPAFMADGPVLNSAAGIRAAFFDGRHRGDPLRLEFLKVG